jgi:hypothetical protein
MGQPGSKANQLPGLKQFLFLVSTELIQTSQTAAGSVTEPAHKDSSVKPLYSPLKELRVIERTGIFSSEP